jgi:hypothetical protein
MRLLVKLAFSESTAFRERRVTDTEDVNVEVRGEDIFSAFGTDHLAIYSRREDSVELRARKLFGPLDFRLRAWILANQKAPRTGVVRLRAEA